MRQRLSAVVGLSVFALVVTLTLSVPAWGQCTAPFDFEDGTLQGFTIVPVTGPPLWHNANNVCRAQLPGHTTTHTLYYGQDSTCNFDTGDTNAANAVSPTLPWTEPSLPFTLEFKYLFAAESLAAFDQAFIDLSIDGGATWRQVASKDKLVNINEWTSARLLLAPSLSGFVLGSSTLTLRFRFDTVDDINNEGTGWHIDDIAVCAVGGIPTLSPPAMVILVLLMATAAFVFLARRRRQARGWPPAAGGTPGLS